MSHLTSRKTHRASRALVLAVPLAAALLLGRTTAFAAVTTPARDSIATLSFSDLAFSNARLRIDATQTIGPGSDGSKAVSFGVAPSIDSYSLSSAGAVAVTLDAFTPPGDFDLTVNASGAGSWTITEGFAGSDDIFGPGPLYFYRGGNDVFVPFTNAKLPALELTLFVGGLVDEGGSFGIGFTIPGNWSTTGGLDSTTGQYFLAGLDSQWSIDTAFVYDPVTDLTRFHATNPAYEGVLSEHPSPFLDVYFFGSVPEPGSWVMLIAGFGLTGAALRRKPVLATVAARS